MLSEPRCRGRARRTPQGGRVPIKSVVFPLDPGNANLPIGGVCRGNSAIQENGGPRGSTGDRVWHSRRYIPHFEGAEAIQHATFHLADSLPRTTLLRIEADTRLSPLKSGMPNGASGWRHGSMPATARARCANRTLPGWCKGRCSSLIRALPPAGLGSDAQPRARPFSADEWMDRGEDCSFVEKVHGSKDLRRPSRSWQGHRSGVASGVLGPVHTRSAALPTDDPVYSRKSRESGLGCTRGKLAMEQRVR